MKRRRLYYLTDSLDSTVAIAQDLEKMGVGYEHMHVLGKNEDGLVRHHVHSATPLEEYDIVQMGERGVILGFLAGLVFIVALRIIEPFGMELPGWAWFAIVVLFTMHGAWAGGLIGTHARSYRIARFQQDVDANRFLFLIDVTPQEESRVRDFMCRQHMDAQYEGDTSAASNPLHGLPFFRKYQSNKS